MRPIRHLLIHNWFQKLFALILATMLWVTIASETSSEIGIEVPLEYRNIPEYLEITGDTTNSVEVRLRGSSNLIKEISSRDVSTILNLSGQTAGEKILTLTAQNVQAPFGAEVVRVNPARVRLHLERTISKMVRVVPAVRGKPAKGYAIGPVLVSPNMVEAEGPESRVTNLQSVPTAPVVVDERISDVQETIGLDVPDPLVRLKRVSTVDVRVQIVLKP